jgi:hypothetical protein
MVGHENEKAGNTWLSALSMLRCYDYEISLH